MCNLIMSTLKCNILQILNPAGTGRQYNIMLTLDQRCILVENEIVLILWHNDVDLMLDFGYTTS